ncbi:MAG TPA: hypothetical protein VGB24_24360 [Longimicrobium sp.]|jgi:hypothetical protein|uniref:hypothetical protein n=1 Tax=Longimicrobium sp. TaxID=2029185 RepID=UPI002EDB31BD
MRFSRIIPLLVATLAAGACLPTADDIDAELEAALQSVVGPWNGTSQTLTLDFQLQAGTGNAVSGSGTMKEAAAAGTVPITVTGTFQRPQLSLTFSGMTFEGKAVQGTFTGNYTTVGGINGPLQLTATGYSKSVTILLQER